MSDDQKHPGDEGLRADIGKKLADGLKTEAYPRAETSEMVNEIVGRLKTVGNEDVDTKLKIAGFTDYTPELDDLEQPCETCMYYLLHRRFCELPELMLPVEPQWSCRLWRI